MLLQPLDHLLCVRLEGDQREEGVKEDLNEEEMRDRRVSQQLRIENSSTHTVTQSKYTSSYLTHLLNFHLLTYTDGNAAIIYGDERGGRNDNHATKGGFGYQCTTDIIKSINILILPPPHLSLRPRLHQLLVRPGESVHLFAGSGSGVLHPGTLHRLRQMGAVVDRLKRGGNK